MSPTSHRGGEEVTPDDSAIRCEKCPLVDRDVVNGEGPSRADVAIVGQAPGKREVEIGRPFVGPAGGVLNEVLRSLRVDRSKLYVTNAVLCHPGEDEHTRRDKRPPGEAIAACRTRLVREIEETEATWVVALGAVATHSLTGRSTPLYESRCSLSGPIPRHLLRTDTLVGVTYHPKAIVAGLLQRMSDDIGALFSLPINGRRPNVYHDHRNRGQSRSS
jgi:DNA polymerase